MAQIFECGICLDEYQEDKLEEHRGLCMARLMFRCTICDGDYVSMEGLWNHLDLHEIADESKELHYQEMRISYKLHQCSLCNDQRGYQENLYWKHVHEAHDDFFLWCSDCGEKFQSQQLKTDHDLTHCKARKQMVTMDSDQNVESIVLPKQEENTASLDSCGGIHESATVKLEPSQEELSCLSLEDGKCSEINICYQQGTLLPEKIKEESDITRLIGLSPENSNVRYDADYNTTEKESEVIPILSLKSISKTDVDQITLKMEISVEETTLLQQISTLNQSTITDCPYVDQHSKDNNVKNSELSSAGISEQHFTSAPERKSDILKEFACTNLDEGVIDSKRVHHIENKQEQKLTDQIALKMEVTVEETTLLLPVEISSDQRPSTSHHRENQSQSRRRSRSSPPPEGYTSTNSEASDFSIDESSWEASDHSSDESSWEASLSRKQIKGDPSDCLPGSSNERSRTTPNQPTEITSNQRPNTSHQAEELSLRECVKCNLKFNTYHKLRYHLKSFHAEPGLKCPDCGKLFYYQSQLWRHMAVHLKTKQKSMSGSTDLSEQQISDDLEQNQSSSFQNVKSKSFHENEIEIGEDQSKACSICGLISSCSMQYHMQKAHAEPKKEIKCSQCPKIFGSNSDLKRHETTHIQEGNVVCKLCPRTFRDKYRLRSHIYYAHPSTESPCDMCDLKFSNRMKLYHHLGKVHAEKKYKCSHCSKLCYTSSGLIRHEKIHSNTQEGRIVCKLCPRTFCDTYKLQKHVYNIHPPSELACGMCTLKFSSRSKLWFHMHTAHTEPKYKCSHCTKTFHTNSKLSRHEKTTHNKIQEKNVACKLCPKTFRDTYNLQRHVYYVHTP